VLEALESFDRFLPCGDFGFVAGMDHDSQSEEILAMFHGIGGTSPLVLDSKRLVLGVSFAIPASLGAADSLRTR
jgi:hypothetical protein